jgi:hypothetical protein
MIGFKSFFRTALLASVIAAGTGGAAAAAEQTAAAEKDPLRATLLESKEKNRGVNIHIQGNTIGCVVTSIDDHYVIGRSNQASRIVIRIDRIDGISAMF